MRTGCVLVDGQFYKMHEITKILNGEQRNNSDCPKVTWSSSNCTLTGVKNDSEMKIDNPSSEEDILNNEQQIPDINVPVAFSPTTGRPLRSTRKVADNVIPASPKSRPKNVLLRLSRGGMS
jgi:hypothetical protein